MPPSRKSDITRRNPGAFATYRAKTTQTIAAGEAVRVQSANDGLFTVIKALGDGSQSGKLMVATIASDVNGILLVGDTDQVTMDTSAGALGDTVYVSSSVAGELTLTSTLEPVGWISEVGTAGKALIDPAAVGASTGLGSLDCMVFVRTANDLPDAVGGVRTLVANCAYYFVKPVDLAGDRLVMAGVAALLGSSSETASITSTGLGVGVPLITSNYTLVIQNLTIQDVDTALALDGTGGGSNVAYDWDATNFLNVPTVGVVENFNNFIMTKSAFLNSGGLTFDGTSDTIAFETSLFENSTGNTSVIVPATATISRRFRIIYSSFVSLSGETSLDVDTSAIANNESYILDTVNFAGGGTYLVGADHTDIESLFVNNIGITNSATVAHYYMIGNATATTISVAGTPVKAAGTTLDGPNISKFTQTANRATYGGNLTEFFQVSVSLAMTSGNNNQLSVYVAKNGATIASSQMTATANGGGRVESTSTFGVTELAPTDYIEVWVANETGTSNITVTELQVIAKRLS